MARTSGSRVLEQPRAERERLRSLVALAQRGDDRLQPRELPPIAGQQPGAGGGLRLGHELGQLFVAGGQLIQLIGHAAAGAGGRSSFSTRSRAVMLTSSISWSGGRVVSDWSHSPGA